MVVSAAQVIKHPYRQNKNFISYQVGRKSRATPGFRARVKAMNIQRFVSYKLEVLSELLTPIIRGWINYFGKFNRFAIKYTMDCVNRRLARWAMYKHKGLRGRVTRAYQWLRELAKREPNLFPHWKLGMIPYGR